MKKTLLLSAALLVSAWIQGFFAPGPAMNDGSPFHLIPWTAHAFTPGTWLTMCSAPPASPAEVQQAIDDNWNQLCEDELRLVRIDSVGSDYLEWLREGASG